MTTPRQLDHKDRPRGALSPALSRIPGRVNRRLNGLAVELLDLQPGDEVLEVGFGRGDAMRMMALRLNPGHVVGVDHSAAMVARARRRNAKAAHQGRVDPRLGEVSRLPFSNEQFDKIYAVDTHEFWPTPRHDFGELHRVLKTDGLMVIGVEVQHPDQGKRAAPGAYTDAQLDALYIDLDAAGFQPEETVIDQARVLRTNCLLVRKRQAS